MAELYRQPSTLLRDRLVSAPAALWKSEPGEGVHLVVGSEFFPAAAPASATGTLAATLGALTATGTAVATVTASAARTLGALTSSATALATVSTTLSTTLGALTCVAGDAVATGTNAFWARRRSRR